MATQTRRIKVEIKGEGSKELRRLAKGFSDISRSSRQTANTLSKFDRIFSRVFAGSVLGIGIRNLTDTADRLQLLRDRIRVFEGESADETFIKIGQAADFTKTSISNIAESYNRLALATKDLGLNSDALLGLTTALQQSFRLSGSTIAEAAAATIQLSQGLASGQLRGQELRSVLEQNAVIGEILAKRFNTARGNLIKFAESGKITSQVVLEALAANAEKLNEDAEKLGQTFGQTLTLAFNKFNLEVDRINRALGLNSAFARALDFLISNLDVLASALVGLTVTAALPSVISGFTALTAAVKGTTLSMIALKAVLLPGALLSLVTPAGLLTAALAGVAAGITFLLINWEKAAPRIAAFTGLMTQSILEFGRDTLQVLEAVSRSIGLETLANNFKESTISIRESLQEVRQTTEFAFDEIARLQGELENTSPAGKWAEALKNAAANVKIIGNDSLPLAARIKALNQLFIAGKINADEYGERLRGIKIDDLKIQFAEGKKDLEAYNKELEKLTRGGALARINEEFSKGAINVTQYTQKLNQLEVERIAKGVDEGTASVLELNKKLLSTSDTVNKDTFQVGIANYVESVGTLAENVAGAVTNTFNTLEDTLVEFVQTGKFNFREFTNSILADLQRIIIRQLIVRQLANAVVGSISGNTTNSASLTANAKGNAFGSSGIIPFQSGGIVSSPTLFGFGKNQTGLMGEAGPEAILPLTRTSNGDLGVKATPSNVVVNIVNNASEAEVSQRESTDSFGNKTIDVLIHTKVKEGLSSGTFDKAFKQTFGLERRGL